MNVIIIHIQVCIHSWYTQPPKRRLVESIKSRSSQRRCSVRKDVLKLLALTCNFIKKEALSQVFSCVFCQEQFFLRAPFWKNTPGRLLLYVVSTHYQIQCFPRKKLFQRLTIPYGVLYKGALTNNHVRCVSSKQIIYELNKII